MTATGTRTNPTVRDIPRLLETARGGRGRATAQLVSLVENGSVRTRRAVAEACVGIGRATVIGLTGSPGVGKSTVVNALIGAYRQRDRQVAVLAVDPSSPFSGGAVLGDRIRMQHHALDPGVYIRSMASRGRLGGLAAAAPEALKVLEACGFDVVLLETVGVGQVEVDVASHADTTVVLVAPGMGDSIQVAKAGILEVADVLVVNKADRPGAPVVAAELADMLHLADRPVEAWAPPVVSLAAPAGIGLSELMQALDDHDSWLAASGRRAARRTEQAAAEIQAVALARLRSSLIDRDHGATLRALAAAVAAGRTDPYTAADQLLDSNAHATARADHRNGVSA
jgi:LAO/AO transport system kinase